MTDFPITELESKPFAFVTRRCAYADMGRVMPAAFAEVAAALGRAGVMPEGPAWTRYTGWDDTGATFDAGFACPEGVAPRGDFHRPDARRAGDDRLAHRPL